MLYVKENYVVVVMRNGLISPEITFNGEVLEFIIKMMNKNMVLGMFLGNGEKSPATWVGNENEP